MTHNLEEPIPGASDTPTTLTANTAIGQLVEAMDRFHAHTGPLAEHFAYGALNKAEYALAHVMHVRNHFEQITW